MERFAHWRTPAVGLAHQSDRRVMPWGPPTARTGIQKFRHEETPILSVTADILEALAPKRGGDRDVA
jgi:hypothetical protein